MKIPFTSVLSQFREHVLNPNYTPSKPVDTLCARLTALCLSREQDASVVQRATAFLRQTSTHVDADLSRLRHFATQFKSLDELQFSSTYTNSMGTHLEYKLLYTARNNSKQIEHSHARYQMDGQLCRFVSKTAPLIRIIGDPILQRPGIRFPDNPTDAEWQALNQQIEIAKSVLIAMNGAGIAANQCAEIEAPYCFAIAGIFHDSEEHVRGVAGRYPGIQFQEAQIMLNAEIKHSSQEVQRFNHGCLSIPSANRFEVVSPMEMSVVYHNPRKNMEMVHLTQRGVDAAILWHELAHILEGKTYVDITLEAFLLMDLNQFGKMVTEELQKRSANDTPIPNLSPPPFHFAVKVNDAGIPRLNSQELQAVLPNMTDDTLSGLLLQTNQLLKKRLDKLGLGPSKFAFHQAAPLCDTQENNPAFSSKL